jgi:hypothetical protein
MCNKNSENLPTECMLNYGWVCPIFACAVRLAPLLANCLNSLVYSFKISCQRFTKLWTVWSWHHNSSLHVAWTLNPYKYLLCPTVLSTDVIALFVACILIWPSKFTCISCMYPRFGHWLLYKCILQESCSVVQILSVSYVCIFSYSVGILHAPVPHDYMYVIYIHVRMSPP